MKIICHRGYFGKGIPENSLESFEKAFENGFGIETDIRDHNQEIVISHDMATNVSLPLKELFSLHSLKKYNQVIALNIKADGLQKHLMKLIDKYNITKYFVFDMSIPDMLKYQKSKIKFYTRMSEYEPSPNMLDKANGLWIDEFNKNWIDKNIIESIKLKNICFVSPEIHRKPFKSRWKDFKNYEKLLKNKNLMLCTDHPQEAEEFFNDKN